MLLPVALGVNEVLALLGGGVIGMLMLNRLRLNVNCIFILPFACYLPHYNALWVQSDDSSLWKIFLFFLKVGAILYGSGYVLIAFLQTDMVTRLGWLTEAQLLDAIAVAQFTPGPILTTATFIGYLLGGSFGAIAGTLGIFLPSFLFVGILNPIVPRLRQSPWTSAFLDSVNVGAVALMVWVLVQIARTTLIDWQAWLIATVATTLAIRFKLNAAWLVLGGAVVGYLLSLVIDLFFVAFLTAYCK